MLFSPTFHAQSSAGSFSLSSHPSIRILSMMNFINFHWMLLHQVNPHEIQLSNCSQSCQLEGASINKNDGSSSQLEGGQHDTPKVYRCRNQEHAPRRMLPPESGLVHSRLVYTGVSDQGPPEGIGNWYHATLVETCRTCLNCSRGASRGAPHGVATLKVRKVAFYALNRGCGASGKVK